MKPAETVLDSIEKVFRYFVPGFTFIVLLRLAHPSQMYLMKPWTGELELLAMVLSLGMINYALHRILLWSAVEPLLYLFGGTAVCKFKPVRNSFPKYPYALAAFFKARHGSENEKLSEYLFYRWSVHHYVLILAELLLVLTFTCDKNSFLCLHRTGALVFGFVVLGLGLANLVVMYVVEKYLFGDCSTAKK